MNPRKLAACFFILAAPFSLLADSATDRQIEDAAKSSYNFRNGLDRDVKVTANEGSVTLTGKVASDEQRRIAEDTVAALPGVVQVNNQLKVEGSREGSDDWIALKIRSRLLVKRNVSLADTKVEVKDGVVMLSGTAPNQAQKELTEAYVKDIAGVRSVKNDIAVTDNRGEDQARVGRDMPTGRDTVGGQIDDSSITAQIKYELFSHRSTSALKTKVDTNHGRVVIGGEAGSSAEKDLVTQIAKTVRGVDSVENDMTIRN